MSEYAIGWRDSTRGRSLFSLSLRGNAHERVFRFLSAPEILYRAIKAPFQCLRIFCANISGAMNPLVNFKDPNLRVLISPKNMRIIALGIAIYQVILSHATLFLVFLGVLHAEEINKMLVSDIEDEKEMNEYTVMPNVQEETLNQIRFKSAQELASLTIMSLYAAFVATAIYLLSSMCLLKGILRNRPNLMIPWMVVNGIGMFLLVAFWLTGGMSSALPQCVEPFYRLSCITVFTLDMVIWFMIRHYYLSLARDKKLTDQLVESATVKIPIQKKEKIIEGNDGYKHHLTDPLMVKIN